MKVINIEWDVAEDANNPTEEEIKILKTLPTELDVENDLDIDVNEYDGYDDLEDAISESLSNIYGYCHNGFTLDSDLKVYEVTVKDEATYRIRAVSADEAEYKAYNWFTEREPSFTTRVVSGKADDE